MGYPITNITASALRFDVSQSLSDPQKAQAQSNIGASTVPGVAASNMLVRGDDFRLGVVGGVSMTASSYVDTSNTPVSTPVEKLWFGKAVSGSFCTFADTATGYSGAEVIAGNLRLIVDSNPVATATVVPTGDAAFSVSCDPGGVWTLRVNGITAATYTSPAILPILDKPTGWPFPFTGECRRTVYFNRILTPDERDSVSRGEMPATLAGKSGATSGEWLNNPPEFSAQGGQPFLSVISSGVGANLQVIANANSFSGCALYLPFPGGEIRVRGTVSAFSGTGLFSSLQGSQIWTVISGTAVNAEGVVVGTGDFEILSVGFSNNSLVLFRTFNSACTATFANLLVQGVGTIEDYPSESVAPSGRWVGRFGNDFIPATDRITPLAPRAQTRVLTGTITDTLIPGVSSGLNEGAAALTIDGGLVLTDDALTLQPTSDFPAGLLLKHTRATATNTVVAKFINLNGSSEQTGTIPVTLVQTIN